MVTDLITCVSNTSCVLRCLVIVNFDLVIVELDIRGDAGSAALGPDGAS